MAITFGPGIAIGAGVAVTPTFSIVTDGLVLHYDFSNPASYPGSGTATAQEQLQNFNYYKSRFGL